MNTCSLCSKETDEFNFDNKICDSCYRLAEWMYFNAEQIEAMEKEKKEIEK